MVLVCINTQCHAHHVAFLCLAYSFGFWPQTWHWNEKRYIAQYYADLAKREAREESARIAMIKEKFAALEEELLA